MILAFGSMLLHFASMPVPRALLGALVAFSGSLCGALVNPSRPKIIENLRKINIFSFWLHVVAFCFHACSKSSPRGWRGFSGSLCGALVNPTRPPNHQKSSKNHNKITDLSFLLHVVSCLFRKLSSGLAWLFGPFEGMIFGQFFKAAQCLVPSAV